MIKLTLQHVLSMHEMLIKATSGSSGLRDEGLLDMSLASAFQTFDGKDIYSSIEEKAARLAFSIVSNHPFVDGNKRIGLFVMLTFLELNGVYLEHTQQELIRLGLSLAEGTIDYQEVLVWVQSKKISGQ